ncbi:3187_t:CDS:2 [Entrophospora sp. SA101]|nr:3187_t:CDS:2 [Entrophospora sp. SA101]
MNSPKNTKNNKINNSTFNQQQKNNTTTKATTNTFSNAFKNKKKINNEPSPAVVHTGENIRIKEQKKKIIFKAVLDSPYNIKWPEVPKQNQEIILEELCNFSSPNPPEILSDLVIGINEVTKYLEKSISQSNNNNHMKSLISAIPKKTNNNDNNGKHQKHHHQPLNVIFVCKYDISPSHLYSHLPIMVCLEGKVLLVQLPINSINKISNNIHIKRCCCIGVKDNSKKEFSKLFNLINEGQIKPIKASWLKPFDQEINNGDDNQEDKEQLLLLNKKRKLEEDFNSNLDSNNINTTISVTATATVVNSSSTTTTNNTNEDFSMRKKVKYIPTNIKQLFNATSNDNKEKKKERKLKYKELKKFNKNKNSK